MRHDLIYSRTAYLLAALALLALVFWPARRMRSQDFIFYLPHQRRVLAVEMIGGTPYLPLLPMLNLAGQVTELQEKRKSLTIWFGGYQLRFRANQRRMQVNKAAIMLSAPIVQAGGQWMAPTSFLSSVLPQITTQPVIYKPGQYRAFLAGARPVSFTVSLAKESSGARLAVHFTGRITVQTASTNGRWIVFLGGAPVEPLEQHFSFQDPYITALDFDDQDGRPKLVITPGEPGLNFYPQLADGGETFVAAVVKPPAAPGQAAPAASAPAQAPPRPAAAPPSAKPPAAAPPAPPPLPAIVLDPGHGGGDTGAHSRDGILEKNLVAQIAAKVAAQLAASKKYRVMLTRSGDADPTIEQRTLAANTAAPAAFVTIHAGELGDRSPVAAVYTYQPGSPVISAVVSGAPGALFVRWDLAQQPELTKSQQLAAAVQQQLARIQGMIAPAPEQAPVRQLRSIAAPAVAIELGTLSPSEPAGSLTSASLQQQVANAIAAALQQFGPSGAKP